LVVILIQLFMQCYYTFGGFMDYMWLYYYANKAYDTLKIKNSENELIVNEKQ
jgi:hypothetical protein